MITLVCDTSNSTCCAGIYDDGRVLSSRISFEKRTHSETFMPLVMEVINASGIKREEIGAIACTVGPGSFTGIRIGISAVKGLSFALGVPCIAVSSTKALAASAEPVDTTKKTLLLSAFDARNKRVFASLRDSETLDEVISEGAYSAADITEQIKSMDLLASELIVVGDGAPVMQEFLTEAGITAQYAEASITPDGVYRASRGLPLISGAEITPAYCAVSSAERLRKK